MNRSVSTPPLEASAPHSEPGTSVPHSWFEPPHALPDAASASSTANNTNFYNIYRSFVAARAALGLVLLILQLNTGAANIAMHAAMLSLCAAYALEALGLWVLYRWRHANKAAVAWSRLKRRQWLATIGADLITFSLLHALNLDTTLNYQALLVLPVLTAGVLTRRLFALAVAASATLLLLTAGWVASQQSSGSASSLLTQAGLTGGALFAIALLANELASRLAMAQAQARGSKEIAQQQADLNQLMIEELHEGVLVMDRQGWVRAANPAARRLLAHEELSRHSPFLMRGVAPWEPILRAVDEAYTALGWPDDGRDVTLNLRGAATPSQRNLRLRIRFTQSHQGEGTESLCVLLFEDTRNILSRLRNEKLAAMGRMSAGVAHEIRNPLASIAQANALLAEDLSDPMQRRLTQMVSDNVERLKRIVHDVLTVTAVPQQPAPIIQLAGHLESICKDWQHTAQLPGGLSDGDPVSPLYVSLPHAGREPLWVRMDPEHLRQIVVNLLDNALRHGTRQPGSARIVLKKTTTDQCRLSVYSDSPPISADTERSLFEPFFSTQAQGTGLGLYISRQLCEQSGASLEYRQRPQGHIHRNEFFITLALVPAPQTTVT